MTAISPASPISTSLLAEALLDRENFAFSRWGDGEWKALLHPGAGHNCDGHDYFPSLGAALAEVLESRPRYLLGMQSFAQKRMGGEISTWLAQRRLSDLVWCDSDISGATPTSSTAPASRTNWALSWAPCASGVMSWSARPASSRLP